MTSPSQSRSPPAPPTSLLRGASLFLDFDGTLVDIAPTPQSVVVGGSVHRLLHRLLIVLEGRVAIVTGRSAADVEERVGHASLAICGHHGLEMRIDGQALKSPQRPAGLDSIVAEMRALERAFPGVQVEDKPLGVALHYRNAPEAEAACRDAAHRAALRSGMDVQPGKMVFELKSAGANKGDAVRALMAMSPFAGGRPLFLGDDLTDEPAFEAAQRLGGAGVRIGERSDTIADYALPSVAAAVDWLERGCAAE